MNLTAAEIAELPLVAAAFDGGGDLIAATPEWEGPAPGAVAYAVRGNRLVVCTGNADPAVAGLTDRLLSALEQAAAGADGTRRRQVAMVAASLRLVAGRAAVSAGTSQDVLDHAVAGLAARSGLHVELDVCAPFPVVCPEVAALVAVQLGVNAERHAGVEAVRLGARDGCIHVSWAGAGVTGGASTARRHDDRQRWGLGFARIAADTLGGTVYPPHGGEDGLVTATLELGLQRLALPIAAVAGNRVVKATPAWDEETGQHPGCDVAGGSRLASCVAGAAAHPGRIAVEGGWWARAGRRAVWVAVPPDDIVDRARDVLDGVVHERALWDGVAEPAQSRVVALAGLLGGLLGVPLPRVPASVWNQRLPGLCSAFGVAAEVPEFQGIGAVDPRIAAHLAAEVGDGFSVEGDDVFLEVRSDRLADPVVRAFVPPGTRRWRLS